jgi:predicted nucleic acid-binding Zn ribbon protein
MMIKQKCNLFHPHKIAYKTGREYGYSYTQRICIKCGKEIGLTERQRRHRREVLENARPVVAVVLLMLLVIAVVVATVFIMGGITIIKDVVESTATIQVP